MHGGAVIGIIKAILGFRQFSLRGLENVKGELNLVALAVELEANVCAGAIAWSSNGDGTTIMSV